MMIHNKTPDTMFEPDPSLLLLGFMDYLKKYASTEFMEHMELTWGDASREIYWDTYYRLKQTSNDLHSPDQDKRHIFLISDFETYHILVMLIDYLKEDVEPDFLEYIQTTWGEKTQDNFWDAYHNIRQSLFNYYFLKMNSKTVDSIALIDLYHLLLVLTDYFKESAEPDFFFYLENTFEESARNIFWDSYYYIKQLLFNIYSQEPNPPVSFEI